MVIEFKKIIYIFTDSVTIVLSNVQRILTPSLPKRMPSSICKQRHVLDPRLSLPSLKAVSGLILSH